MTFGDFVQKLIPTDLFGGMSVTGGPPLVSIFLSVPSCRLKYPIHRESGDQNGYEWASASATRRDFDEARSRTQMPIDPAAASSLSGLG